MPTEHQVLHGIGVSAGTASGPVVKVHPAPGVDQGEPPTTDAAEACLLYTSPSPRDS